MKRLAAKFGSLALALLMLVNLLPTAYAASTSSVSIGKASADNVISGKTFEFVYKQVLAADSISKGSPAFNFTIASGEIAKVRVETSEQEISITKENDGDDTMTFVRPVWLYLPTGGSATLTSPIKLTNDMMIRANTSDYYATATLAMNQAITITDGATLLLDGMDNASVKGTEVKFVNNTSGSAIIVEEGGTVRVGAVILSSSEENFSPFISSTGGTVIIEGNPSYTNSLYYNGESLPTDDTYAPTGNNQTKTSVETSTALVEAKGGTEVEIKDGDITATGEEPLIKFEGEGNSVTLSGGNISGTKGPALTIPEGVTLVIPEDSTAQVTTQAEDKQAIDLAAGSTVKKGDIEITVSQDNDEAGDNYVDNYGNIILAAGATADSKTLNAAVILPDGTIIQGSEEEAPVVAYSEGEDGETVTTVTVPVGGSVQKSDGTVTALPGGGSVTQDADTTEMTVNVADVTLDETELTLTVGETASLTATVEPENASNQNVTWTSSDEEVATVDSDGVVTAVSVGEATITVTTEDGGQTATCAVTVEAVGAPTVTLTGSASLTVDGTETLTYTLGEDTAVVSVVSNAPSIVEVVSYDNGSIQIKALAEGSAKITITVSNELGVEAQAACTVTVKAADVPPVDPVDPTPDEPTPDEPTEVTVTLDKASLSLTVGGSADLTYTIDSDTTVVRAEYSTSNSSVATVDANGRVTAVGAGTATITVTVYTEDGGEYTAECKVTVTRKSSGNGGGSASYTVSAPSSVSNGTVSVSPKNASKGTTVTITVKPDAGYELSTLTVRDADGNKLALTKKSDTQYTFVMPASKVTVAASFTEIVEVKPTTPTNPFTDVKSGDWYSAAAQYVYEKGLMAGVSATQFGGNITTTRGMIATMLYSLAGKPRTGTAAFPDVSAGQYYADPVAWASANGVVAGYGDGSFGPNDTITREQLALMLYNYAALKGYDTSASASLTRFVDGEVTSGWAVHAMEWAVGAGLLSGKDGGRLDPIGSATRAEVAQILMNFCENIVE